MRQVVQLDAAGYFVGITTADESPLEQGVFLLPAGTVDTTPPIVPEGKRAKWDGEWVIENVPSPPAPPTPEQQPLTPEQIEESITENRRYAYQIESDPLFFKAQRGEATMEEWQAKVAEIKARFPK